MYSFEEKFTLMTYFIHNYISFAVNQIALYHRTRTSISFWYKQVRTLVPYLRANEYYTTHLFLSNLTQTKKKKKIQNQRNNEQTWKINLEIAKIENQAELRP